MEFITLVGGGKARMDWERLRKLLGGGEVGVGCKDRFVEVQGLALGRRRDNHFMERKKEGQCVSCFSLV